MKIIRPIALLVMLLFCAVCPALLRAQAAAEKLTANDLVERGLAKNDKGDLDGAIADYNHALELDPKFIRAFGNRGEARRTKGDMDGAITDYSRVIELDPNNALAYTARGDAKRGKGDFEGAIADYSRAIELEPKSDFAYIGRGMAKTLKGDFDGAINDFSRAMEINPEDMLIFSAVRGEAKRYKGDLDGAMVDVNRMFALNPKFSVAFFLRARIKQDKGDLDAAIADFSRAIELDPNVVLHYLDRGIAKRTKQDVTGALADFRQGAKLDYLYSAFWVFLTQAESGQRDSGAKELAEALGRAKQPGTDGERWTAQVGDFLLGRSTFTNFFAQANTAKGEYNQRYRICEAWFYHGMLQKIAGQRTEAADSFRKAIATNHTTSPEYQQAVRELKALEAGTK
jgi:tetratricopeptide (TPR) repeat protein